MSVLADLESMISGPLPYTTQFNHLPKQNLHLHSLQTMKAAHRHLHFVAPPVNWPFAGEGETVLGLTEFV